MLENDFVVIDLIPDIDNTIITLRCKQCDTTFEAHIAIFFPKNCKCNLGSSITIICPTCNKEAIITEKNHQIRVFVSQRDILKKSISHIESMDGLFFTVKRVDKAHKQLVLGCLACDHVFICNPKKNINGYYEDDKLIIVCPDCGKEQCLTKEIAINKLNYFTSLLLIEEYDKLIKELEEEDNAVC